MKNIILVTLGFFVSVASVANGLCVSRNGASCDSVFHAEDTLQVIIGKTVSHKYNAENGFVLYVDVDKNKIISKNEEGWVNRVMRFDLSSVGVEDSLEISFSYDKKNGFPYIINSRKGPIEENVSYLEDSYYGFYRKWNCYVFVCTLKNCNHEKKKRFKIRIDL
ncbi:MAG: hypothetical protein PUD79_08115 [Prevotellaceae bacterium]|nr:hypothetical protein [Prevotellaceae bacterium]